MPSRSTRATRAPQAAIAVVVALLVLAGIGRLAGSDDDAGGVTGTAPTSSAVAQSPPSSSPESTPAPPPPPPPPEEPLPPPTPEGVPAVDPLVGQARAALPLLEVKGRAPRTGYDRDLFGQRWSDDVSVELGRNGCDTRNDILRRDLREVVTKPGTRDCVVLSGVLDGPYTGERIDFVRGRSTSNLVQIDHVVAMADAWQKGAQQLSEERRRDFANDPLNLLAVAGHSNQHKGAGDAATWLPPRKEFRCAYVARQVLVKDRYDLWVTPAERDAMDRILAGCG
ncbi:HNH endonuclease family protein [Dietzia sp. 179-F 9C3 NHS]|uniref:HNH endonuclease family protein n=1 Tax=Dietzia sp. 179-F 9C3 NHS TaxID=3374295 RepID=UPI003879B6A9